MDDHSTRICAQQGLLNNVTKHWQTKIPNANRERKQQEQQQQR